MDRLDRRPSRHFVIVGALAGALCMAAGPASAAGASGSASAPSATAKPAATDAVGLMVVPVAIITADTMNNGCWARFYSDQNLRGDVLALGGPVSLPNMDRVQPFWGDADSVLVGPKARVTTFDNDNYRDQTAVLAANQRIDNLRDRLRWNEGVESVRVECIG